MEKEKIIILLDFFEGPIWKGHFDPNTMESSTGVPIVDNDKELWEMNDKISDLSNSNTKKLLVTLTVSRRAKLFLFDDPVGGVDTSTMSYILDAIAAKCPADSAVIITSRTPADVERIIQDAAFISAGRITLFADAEGLRAEKGKSVNAFFAEVNRC